MKIQKLTLTNVRAFKQAEFEFRPGMNLLVGLNGLGKTTVLDALRIMLSQVLPHANKIRGDSLNFDSDDIRVSADALSAELKCEVPGADITYTAHKPRAHYIPKQGGNVRDTVTETPKRNTLVAYNKNGQEIYRLETEKQLAVFFSTRRALASDAQPSKRKSGGDFETALAEALSSRELRLTELAFWMEAQRQLGKEQPSRLKHLASIQRAAKQFLPECKNLRSEITPRPRLLVEKEKLTLDVRQLSDGERGILALVLDLAKRLSQLNSAVADPVAKGEAVVLIDELDLHLHPQWQRTIVGRLTETFPKCQFIATTHSPQIVAAVEPEQVLLVTKDGITRPDRSLGMDTNWILRHLMEDEERPATSGRAIREVEALIRKGDFRKARKQIAIYRKRRLDLPEWSVLEARMARMEVLAK